MSPSEQHALLARAGDILTGLMDPATAQPYWTANQLAGALSLADGVLQIRVTVGYPVALAAQTIEAQVRAALAALGAQPVQIDVRGQIESHVVQRNLPLLKGASLVGVFWGDFARREPQANAAMMAELAQWYGQGKIKPVIDRTMPMSELKAAYAHMGSRGVKGKLVMVN